LKREDTKLINKLIKNIINEKDKSGHSNISNILNKNNNTEKNKFSNNNYYDKTGENCNVLFWCEKIRDFFTPKI